MYQVNRTAWDRGLVSKAAMGDNLNKALWKLEIILENHHRQHAVPCSSSFIIIVDPISIFPKKSSSRWWPGPAEPLPSPQQPLCSSFPSQLRPVKSELIKIQYVLKLLANYYHDYHLVAINGMYSAVWKSARHGNAGKGKLVFANLWLSTLSWKYLTLHSQLEIFDLRFPLTNLDEALPQPRSRTTPPWSKARLSKCEKGNFQFKVNLFEGCGDSFEFRQCHPTLGLSCIDLCVGLLYKVAKLAWKYHETLLYPCLCRNDAEMINTKSQW